MKQVNVKTMRAVPQNGGDMYDCIVIGAGIAGAVAARKLAEEKGKRVLVMERRPHIGGNCYDEKDAHGILIHNYGPHIFHTGLEEVFAYLSRFTDWYLFGHEVVAKVGDQLIPVPFNLNTLHMVYDKEKADRLEQKLIETYGEGSRAYGRISRQFFLARITPSSSSTMPLLARSMVFMVEASML